MGSSDDALTEATYTVFIKFEDNDFGISCDYLRQQADRDVLKSKSWNWPDLQFVSFKDGRLCLRNSSGTRSYKLILQAQETDLLVSCNCDGTRKTICEHAFYALYNIIIFMDGHYFRKLQPGGLMELALAHKRFFNKKENKYGLDVSPRPELKSVYKFDAKIRSIDLRAVMELPGTVVENDMLPPGQALAYMVILPSRHRFLPVVIPCMGKLNKDETGVKSFDRFLSSLQKEHASQLTYGQKELNKVCHALWKLVEPLPGSLFKRDDRDKVYEKYLAIWSAWQQLIPLLQKQPFVYSYHSYNIRNLKGKPRKARVDTVKISTEAPILRFVLMEKEAMYRLELKVWVHNTLLEQYNAEAPFFILHEETLYMLNSFRDAVIMEWICHAEGCITIFKEHYAEFEKDWLNQLCANYTVEVIPKKTTKKAL